MINEKSTEHSYKTNILIWMAFLVSVILYFSLVEFMGFIKPDDKTNMTIFYLLLGLSIVEISLIPFLKKHFSKSSFMDFETPSFEEVLKERRSRFTTSSLIAYAIAETPALYGTFLVLKLECEKNHFYTLIGISIITLLINFPSKAKWDSIDGYR